MVQKMTLNGQVLSTLIQKKLDEADVETAPTVIGPDGRVEAVVSTPQKIKERKAQTDAIAITIIDYLIKNTEVIIPEHPTAVAMTGISGGPVHSHTTNVPPIPHKIGRIK